MWASLPQGEGLGSDIILLCPLRIALSALTGTASRRRGRALAIALLVPAFACTRSLISHAAAQRDLNWMVFLDGSHLLLIDAWTGEVLVATLLVLPRLD